MIVGNGLLARTFAPRFAEDPHIVIFASGVSNSMERRSSEFARERLLLQGLLEDHDRPVVYFGSCGVLAAEQTPYMAHKREMESLVLATSGGMVLRLPQVVGATRNPHTLTNFIRDRILADEHFTVWSRAERNLIDVDDIAAIGAIVIEQKKTPTARVVAIAASRSMAMPAIVSIFERVLRRRAIYAIENRGSPLPIDSSTAVSVAAGLGIDLGPAYAERIIRKYYGSDAPC